jgi:hypothetical protein
MTGVVDDETNTGVSGKIYGKLDLRNGRDLQCLRWKATEIACATGCSVLRQTGCALVQRVHD